MPATLHPRPPADPDPQLLLPEDVRHDWAVLPRDAGYKLVLAGFVLGAGSALSVVGLATGDTVMALGFPLALLLAMLQNVLLPWSDSRVMRNLRHRTG